MAPTDTTTAAPPAGEERELLGTGERVAQLLEEVRATAGPPTWQRVEELVQRLLQLYGAGLERVLRHAAALEREPGALAARLEGDALASSLLLLHGLHPAPTDARVERALVGARARLGLAGLELVAVEADGTVRVRATATATATPTATATATATALARAIERTVVEAAPEVTRVVVEGLPAAPPAREPLVQLRAPAHGEAGR
jgi:hypothetical protein